MAILILAALVSQWERLNLFGRVGEGTGDAIAWLRDLGESLDPQIVVAPVAGASEQVFVSSGLAAAPNESGVNEPGMNEVMEPQVELVSGAPLDPTLSMTMTAPTPTNVEAVTQAITQVVTLIPTETPLPTPIPTETPQPVPSETPTPTLTPTPVPSDMPTSTSTQTPIAGSLATEPTATKANAGAVIEAAQIITATTTMANARDAMANARDAITATSGVTITHADAVTPTASTQLLPSPTPTPNAAAAALLPTATSTLDAPAATATPVIYVVQAGDTAMGIALRFRVSLADLINANGLTAQEARLLRPGQQFVIPSAEAVQPANAVSTPTAEAAGALYTVQSGDTIIAIASRTGATVDNILAANGMTEADARGIRPGDELVIPAAGATIAPPTATPTSAPSLTPTPTTTRLPPTLTPTATPVALRLAAPILLSPESGAAVSCAGADKLVWSPVQFVTVANRYRLNLGYVSSRDGAGNPIVTWVIQQLQPAGLTQWNMDASLCALAPQELGRQWRWYVDVVELVNGAAVPVSPPSDVWGFSWN